MVKAYYRDRIDAGMSRFMMPGYGHDGREISYPMSQIDRVADALGNECVMSAMDEALHEYACTQDTLIWEAFVSGVKPPENSSGGLDEAALRSMVMFPSTRK
jgi:hypothetical protein